MNWNDPIERAALVERVGVAEYEAEASEAAYLWAQALGFSVEAKFQPPIQKDQ